MAREMCITSLESALRLVGQQAQLKPDIDLSDAHWLIEGALTAIRSNWPPNDADKIIRGLCVFATKRLEPQYQIMADQLFGVADIIRKEIGQDF